MSNTKKEKELLSSLRTNLENVQKGLLALVELEKKGIDDLSDKKQTNGTVTNNSNNATKNYLSHTDGKSYEESLQDLSYMELANKLDEAEQILNSCTTNVYFAEMLFRYGSVDADEVFEFLDYHAIQLAHFEYRKIVNELERRYRLTIGLNKPEA